MFKHVNFICWFGIIFFVFLSCKTNPGTKQDEGPSPPKTPAEELASFQFDPGLKVQLVAAEPLVQDPVVITFDEDGRLWVVEMRGFMPNIDGVGEEDPVGRISVLEDTNGDGQMDFSTIFMDSLIMPRAIALVPGGALVVEDQKLWYTEDLDGDLKADSKILIDPEYAGSALPEHSGNGLWRSMDNWYYNVKSRLRYRLVDGEWQRDSTEFRGQWGISHDDKGRLYYNYNWSQLHADLVPPNYLSRNKNYTPTTGIDHGLTVDRRIYPIRPNPAVNRGYIPGTLDEEGKLLEFTAACSPFYYRATTLPNEYYGNAFVCEPSGNLIKRNVVEEKGLFLSAYDPNPGREFLASTDERFRPVHLATGPDGALYVADMYRGLVQHGAYVTPYLKEQTITRKLVQPINYGRIWRIVPADWKPSRPVALSKTTGEELVQYLSHSNGWYRDIAQRLLIERNDKNVEKVLQDLALQGNNFLGRFHALWTLEGLNLLKPDVLFQAFKDVNPLVAAAALSQLEALAREDQQVRTKLGEELQKPGLKAPQELILQMALSAEVLDENIKHPLLAGILESHGGSTLIRDAVMSSLQDEEFAFVQNLWASPDWQNHLPAKAIFLEMLTSSIVRKGDGRQLSEILVMLDVDKEAFGWQEKAVLTGLVVQGKNQKAQPVKLSSAPGILSRTDLDITQANLKTITNMFEWPGHSGKTADTADEIVLDEREQQLFSLGRQHYLSSCAGCHGTEGEGISRFAPPLVGSEWVTGDPRRLALIILHGMEGPVEIDGKVYDAPDILPVMPAHSTMDDASITAIMTYIRNEWGNNAGPVNRRLVGATRLTSQGRVVPWTAEELEKYVAETELPVKE
ncbi:hypothetical protein BH23BAC1_BH23BAC1_31640 [soil metagenome]